MGAVNNSYDDLFDHWGRVFDVNPQLGKTVFHNESQGNANSPNGTSGEVGGMQIMPTTAAGLEITNGKDMKQAVPAAMRYLREGLDATGTAEGALAYYNGGPKTLERILPSTQAYVAKAKEMYPRMTVHASSNNGDAILESYKQKAAGQPAAPGLPPLVPRAGEAPMPPSMQAPASSAPEPTSPAADPLVSEGDAILRSFTKPATAEPTPAAAVANTPPVSANTGDSVKQAGVDTRNAVMNAIGSGLTSVPQTSTAIPAVIDAAARGFGAEPLGMGNKLVSGLRQAGIYGPSPGTGNMLQNLNEGFLGPIGAAADLAFRTGGGIFRGGQEAVKQALGNGTLGRDVAAIPEAFMGSPGQFAGPSAPPTTAEAARPQFVSERFAPPASPGQAPLARINQLIAHDNAEISGNGPQMQTPPDVAQNLLSPGDGGTRSVGAAASRDMTAPGDLVISPRDTQAYRSVAETQKLLEPQPIGRDPTLYVNGVNPTQAHIEQSANVSREAKMLESAIPEEAKTVAKEHNEARQKHFADLAGSDVDINNAIAARSQQAQTDLAATWQNKTAANPQPVFDTIQQVLDSPDGRRTLVQKAVGSVEDAMTGPDGKPFTDPEQLYGVRKHIDDLLSKEAAADNPASIRAKASLLAVKSALDTTIEASAPGFRQYLDNFSRASRPIDEMQVLQKYEPKLYGAGNQMQFSSVQRMMKDIVTSRKSGEITPFNSISDDTMAQLWALRDDLRRVASSDDLARAKGSDTLQNALDVAKQIGSGGAKLAIGAAAHNVAPIVGPLIMAPLVNRLTSGFTNFRTQRRAQNMLRPDPSQYRPLNPPD